MIPCREVSLLLSTGHLADAPLARRIGVRLHLAMCKHCSALSRQLERLAQVARVIGQAVESEPAADLESKVAERLGLGT